MFRPYRQKHLFNVKKLQHHHKLLLQSQKAHLQLSLSLQARYLKQRYKEQLTALRCHNIHLLQHQQIILNRTIRLTVSLRHQLKLQMRLQMFIGRLKLDQPWLPKRQRRSLLNLNPLPLPFSVKLMLLRFRYPHLWLLRLNHPLSNRSSQKAFNRSLQSQLKPRTLLFQDKRYNSHLKPLPVQINL